MTRAMMSDTTNCGRNKNRIRILFLLTITTVGNSFFSTNPGVVRGGNSKSTSANIRTKPPAGTTAAFLSKQPGKPAWTANTMMKMKLWPSIGDKVGNENDIVRKEKITIGKNIGSGSYGTVHLASLLSDDDDDSKGEGGVLIAKRAWTIDELRVRLSAIDSNANGSGESEEPQALIDEDTLRKKAKRCQHYLEVEKHCFTKLTELQNNSRAVVVPDFVGTYTDHHDQHQWIVFKMVRRRSNIDDDGLQTPLEPAKTLAQAIDLDWIDQHSSPSGKTGSPPHHHLYIVQEEMGLPSAATFADTLDTVFASLLQAISTVHSLNIVHRDIKPHNLLLNSQTQSLVVIDFGSAADMEPSSSSSLLPFGKNRRVGYNDEGNTVAVSPIYAAPETFIEADRAPLNFDTFSSALVFCQLMFNLLDERSDAGFRQQLQEAKYDLDSWLSRELASTVRFAGLDDALFYLAERPGLWSLLKEMLHPNPEIRISSQKAHKRFQDILSYAQETEQGKGEQSSSALDTGKLSDGPYFESVLESLDICSIPMYDDAVAAGVFVEEQKEREETTETAASLPFLAQPRPLHFVATFERQYPLGLILSEAQSDDDDEEEADKETEIVWEEATRSAQPGEVFVKGIVQDGQAYNMDIFEVGDRLRAVGELPLLEGGFEYAIELLQRQPQNAKTVKLHFDRLARRQRNPKKLAAPHLAKVVGQGAWSSRGRRKAQEDAFVLHEIHDHLDNNILMMGVFDGHGGTAASKTCSQMLPSLFASEIASSSSSSSTEELRQALLSSWDITCSTYRNGCDEYGLCVADYDPREGILLAGEGSKDLVAGTTAAMAIVSVSPDGTDDISVLNCGDSRVLLIGEPIGSSSDSSSRESVVHFSTRDHSPSCDLEASRLQAGRDAGLDYSLPQCSLNRWFLTVGDYRYALSRSLEGSLATSCGIVSDPDVTNLSLAGMLSERENGIIAIATDGVFEVLDNEQIGRELLKMRKMGFAAGDAAKNICGMAIEKGTSDNVSMVVVYIE